MARRHPNSKKIFKEIVKLKEDDYSPFEISTILYLPRSYICRVLTASNQGFSSIGEYQNFLVKKRGYNGHSHYQTALGSQLGRLVNSYGTTLKQKEFEESIETRGLLPEEAHRTNIDGETFFEEMAGLDLSRYLNRLTIRQREVIQRRFYLGETLEEVGNKINLSHTQVREIACRALLRLKFFIKTQDKLSLQDFL